MLGWTKCHGVYIFEELYNQKTFHVTTLQNLVTLSFFSLCVHNVGLESFRSPPCVPL